jgi:hypothetical protein
MDLPKELGRYMYPWASRRCTHVLAKNAANTSTAIVSMITNEASLCSKCLGRLCEVICIVHAPSMPHVRKVSVNAATQL